MGPAVSCQPVPERPLVSIVTPTLNQRAFIEATLRSVRAQSYAAIEHLIVDGGSTDGSLEILRREGDRGTIRWISEPDDGMYDAVNKGLALAKGEVMGYLNSDDAYLPWAIDAVMRVFEARPSVDVVFGDGTKVEEETGVQRLRLFPRFDRVSLANYESLMQPAVFWRRRVMDRIGGFDTGLRYVADLDYWLRASGAGASIEHVDEVIAIERIHAARLSITGSDPMAEESAVMRARHGGSAGGPAGRQRARTRDMRWQRLLWLRFVLASFLRPLPGPWRRFLREGRVTVNTRRALSGSRPHRSKRLRNAVLSGLAVEVLRADVT